MADWLRLTEEEEDLWPEARRRWLLLLSPLDLLSPPSDDPSRDRGRDAARSCPPLDRAGGRGHLPRPPPELSMLTRLTFLPLAPFGGLPERSETGEDPDAL